MTMRNNPVRLLFIDTSSLFKFYYPESGSDAVEARMAEAGRLSISELSRVEFLSIVARKVRMRDIDRKQYTRLMSAFDEDCLSRTYAMIPVNGEVLDEARSLMERLGLQSPLRTLDSLQLACAMRSGAEDFLCHDTRLAEMAEQIGLHVVNS